MVKKRKSTLRKVWHFIWEDDSIWSWIVNIVLAYILIKFIVYPILGFTLTTTHPIVAVVSGSMTHDGGFDEWWQSRAICASEPCTQAEFYSTLGITKTMFNEYWFSNGFNKGDIMVLRGVKPENLNPGDVLVFQASRPDPIIHRIVRIYQEDESYFFQTKGDHNLDSIDDGFLNEVRIDENQLIGKAIFRFPYLGYIKIWFVEFIGDIRA